MSIDPAPIQLHVDSADAGMRLDVFGTPVRSAQSRSPRRAITAGHVLVDGNRAKPGVPTQPGPVSVN